MIDTRILYAQLLGAGALLTIILSVQFKKKKNVMLMQAISNMLYTFQYILLNVISAASLNVVTLIRCLIYYNYDKKRKKIPFVIAVIFSIISIILGIVFYEGLLTIIPVAITISYTVSSLSKNANIFRKTFLVCSFVWIFYNYTVGAYVAMIGNIGEIFSTIIALKRYKKK